MNIRPAVMSDYDQLCELFDEVDALHRDTLQSFRTPPACAPPPPASTP